MTKRDIAGLLVSVVLGAGACGAKTRARAEATSDATQATFTAGMEDYLQKRGDLCLGRAVWPVDVTENDRAAHSRDAVQLPVLETLGLLTSSQLTLQVKGPEGTSPMSVTRYRLSARGRPYFVDRATRRPITPDSEPVDQADFCVVKLSLAHVGDWEIQKSDKGPPTALVSYTYAVQAPSWTSTPAFQKVFPAVARVIRGAGTARLKEGFTLTPTGWVANELVTPPAAAARMAQAQAARR